jgi:hypothetical protein
MYRKFMIVCRIYINLNMTPYLGLRKGVYYPYSLSPFVKVDENYQMCNLSIIHMMMIVKDIIMLKENYS